MPTLTMTARERVLAAVEHREPDRVPIDLGATPSSGISAIAYARLKQHLGPDRRPRGCVRCGAATRPARGSDPRPLRHRCGGCGPGVQRPRQRLVQRRAA